MKAKQRLIWAILLLALLVPVAASAQPGIGSDTEKVEAELERTDRVIERARDQIPISVSGRAGGFLGQAISIQREAWQKFRSREPRVALTLTMKARDLAHKALVTATDEVKAHETLPEMIESVQDLVDRARAEIDASGDPQAQRLLEGGIAQLRRAREEFRGRHYRNALGLLKTARDLVQRALHRVRSSSSEETTRIEKILERTELLLVEVKGRLRETPNEEAERLYEEAARFYDRALAQFREGRLRAALRLASQSRQLALDALLRLTGEPTLQEVERAITIVDQLISDLAPEIRASGSEQAATLLDSSRQRLNEATAQMGQGHPTRAIEMASLADGLLKRAVEAAGLK